MSQGRPEPLPPRTLFPVPPLSNAFGWGLSPDGKRFLFLDAPSGPSFEVKTHWAAMLEK